MNTYPQPILRARMPPSLSRAVRRAGRALLRILCALVVLVLAVPAAILPARRCLRRCGCCSRLPISH
jgi:hypothetical protein